MITRRIYLSLFTLVLVSALVACGANSIIRGFRAALTASGPLVTSLVNAGTITQSKADAVRKDFDDGAICAQNLEAAFAAIPADATDKTQRKLSASVSGMRCWRVVVERQNFNIHPRIKQAADIADGIMASMVVFYSEPGTMVNEVGRPTAVARDEKELKAHIEAEIKRLEAALKP